MFRRPCLAPRRARDCVYMYTVASSGTFTQSTSTHVRTYAVFADIRPVGPGKATSQLAASRVVHHDIYTTRINYPPRRAGGDRRPALGTNKQLTDATVTFETKVSNRPCKLGWPVYNSRHTSVVCPGLAT